MIYFNDSKAFVEYSNDLNDIYKKHLRIKSKQKTKTFSFFDDMMADMFSDKKFNPIVTELFIREEKLKAYLVFIITQFYFAVPKYFRLYSTRYFVMKIPNKIELRKVAFNHSSGIGFQSFKNLHKKMYIKNKFFFSY